MNVVVADTETTGFKKPIVPIEVCLLELTGDDPRTFEIGERWHRFFNPGKEIEYGAMCTHLRSNAAARKQPPWKPALLPHADMYIGHSIDYDYEALGRPAGVTKRVCTNALARRAFPEVDSYKLGALLIYVLGEKEALPLLAGAHSADVDALNCAHLVRKIAGVWDIATWDELYDMSEVCRVPLHMGFGKYGPDQAAGTPGMPISMMVAHDVGYVRWLKKLPDLDPYLRKAIEQAGG